MSDSPAQRVNRGLTDDDLFNPRELLRDTRPLWQQFIGVFRHRFAMLGLLSFLAFIAVFVPALSAPMLLLATLIFTTRMIRLGFARQRLPFRLPASAGQLDYSDPLPGRRGYAKSEGIFLVGNEESRFSELWLKAKDILTHTLVFGTTGSGKTEFLVSLSFNALATGSGYFYIDPKGAPKLVGQNYIMCRFMGRDDDFRVQNFAITGKPTGRTPRRVTNNTNPFATGSAEALTQLLVALLPPAGDQNSIFQNNAQALITALMYALVELRDSGELRLSVETIRDHMNIARYVDLAMRNDLKPSTTAALKAFLRNMGWQEGQPMARQPRSFPEQFGYAQAYFGLSLSSLTDTYGHIYLTPYGEVYMPDVIKNRRALVTILPALDMAPEMLKNIGQIALSSVRNSCATGLGEDIEGTFEDVIESLPTDAPSPFLSVTDEYAAIPTPGYSEVLTQGRGLGIAAIVASQDLPGITKADEIGAKQILANTKVKYCMKIEDAEETFELFKKIAAEGDVAETGGFEMKTPESGVNQRPRVSYIDNRVAQINKRDRIHLRDLQEQIEGEFHAFFNGDVVRGNGFYAAPPVSSKDGFKANQIRINQMLTLERPDRKELEADIGALDHMVEQFVTMIERDLPPDVSEPPLEIRESLRLLRLEGSHVMDRAIAVCCAWGEQMDGMVSQLQERKEAARRDGEDLVVSPDEPSAPEAETKVDLMPPLPATGGKPSGREPGREIPEPVEPDEKDDRWARAMGSATTWYQRDVESGDMKEEIRDLEARLGATPEQAREASTKVERRVRDGLDYPPVPTPKNTPEKKSEIENLVSSMIDRAKKSRWREES